MALLSVLLELSPAASAAEEAPLPAAFLEFLAEMIEEEGELLDPLLLAPVPLAEDAEPAPEQPPARGDAGAEMQPDRNDGACGRG